MTPGDSPTPSPPELSAEIDIAAVTPRLRAELKARFGLNRRAVSIQTRRYRTGGEIHVALLTPGISSRKVRRLAERYERSHQDPLTGDPYKSGCRFVSVVLEDCVFQPFMAPIFARLHELPLGSVETFHPVRFGRYCFRVARTVDTRGEEAFRLNGPRSPFYTPHEITRALARILAQSRQWRRLLALATSKESRS